jgi:AraC-like DNA-binding protein
MANLSPLASGIPPLLHLRADACPTLSGFDDLVRLIQREHGPAHPGEQSVVNRLVQILFVQSLRAFVLDQSVAGNSRHPSQTDNWLSATLDPLIGPAVGWIHSQPQEPWTVTELAGRVSLSKSAFSERFREVVGKPPLQYLTDCRMKMACQLLRETDLGIKLIASRVGYESASSFSNAFKRSTGSAPADFRKQGEATANA